MKKRLLAILALLVALTLVVLTGCEKQVERKGNDDDKTTKAEATDEVKEDNEDNEGEDDTTEESEVVSEESSEEGEDKPSKPSKPESGNSAIADSDDFFEDDKSNDKVSQDYVEDMIENGENVDSEEDIIKSGEFVVALRQVAADGTVSLMKLARKGDNIAVFMDNPDEKMGVIVTADVMYMIFTDEKAYFSLPTELLGEDIDELTSSFDEALDLDSESDEPVKTYTETIDGVEYTVEENEDGLKTYCIGNREVMCETEDGGMMYIDSLSGEVPDSIFEAPSGYRQLTMDEFAEMMQ